MNYNENPIGAYTAYSYDELRDYRRSHAVALRRVFLALAIVLFVIVTVFTTLLARSWKPYFEPREWLRLMGPVALPMLILLLSWMSMAGLFFTRGKYDRATRMVRNGQSYAFCENDFSMQHEQQDAIGQARVAYSVIDHVAETPRMFYLYINRNQAYLVSKAGLRSGSPDELRALLLRHVPPNRYRRKG